MLFVRSSLPSLPNERSTDVADEFELGSGVQIQTQRADNLPAYSTALAKRELLALKRGISMTA